MRVKKPIIISRHPETILSSSQFSSLAVYSPPSSQQQTSSPLPSKTKPLQQSYLNIGIHNKKTCLECGMSFLKNVQSDIKMHQKYHQRLVNGIVWTNLTNVTKIEIFTPREFIIKINHKKPVEVSKTLEILQIVNQALNAPDDNEFWMNKEDQGSAFLYIKNKVAIGIVTVSKQQTGRWYSIEDGRIVSNNEVPIICGISRIFVASSQRRNRIASRLLNCVRNHMIYGVLIPKAKLAWSQPSFSGGKLAAVYNGVRHKSGKVLVPVYKEF